MKGRAIRTRVLNLFFGSRPASKNPLVAGQQGGLLMVLSDLST